MVIDLVYLIYSATSVFQWFVIIQLPELVLFVSWLTGVVVYINYRLFLVSTYSISLVFFHCSVLSSVHKFCVEWPRNVIKSTYRYLPLPLLEHVFATAIYSFASCIYMYFVCLVALSFFFTVEPSCRPPPLCYSSHSEPYVFLYCCPISLNI